MEEQKTLRTSFVAGMAARVLLERQVTLIIDSLVEICREEVNEPGNKACGVLDFTLANVQRAVTPFAFDSKHFADHKTKLGGLSQLDNLEMRCERIKAEIVAIFAEVRGLETLEEAWVGCTIDEDVEVAT